MEHFKPPIERAPYHCDLQRTQQVEQHLVAMWSAVSPHELQQHMWHCIV